MTNQLQQLSRGGESLNVEKSQTTFVMKRRQGSSSSEDALNTSALFEGLKVSSCPGRNKLELCRVSPERLEETMDALRGDPNQVAWCGHVYHMPNDPDGILIPTEDIYVELTENALEAEINEILESYGLEISPAPSGVVNAFILRLTSASKENPLKLANELLKLASVKVAEPDLIALVKAMYRPIDTLFDQQWHLENLGGFGLTAGADVNAPGAWDISRGNRDIVVAVIDDGFDIDHPDFSSPGKVLSPADFGQDDLDPRPVSSRDNHGTSCAGVAVADENGSGVVGLAPNCKLMPIRWSGSISDTDIREQFDHARMNGADVISCSWGVTGNTFTLSTSMINTIRRAATEGRNGKGCVIVFAAGNSNHDIDDLAGGTRDGFAIHPNVIAVAASNSHDRRSHYSNFGDMIWICAPSSGAGGMGIVTTDRSGNAGYQSGEYTTVERFGGTSSSTPLVAGLCGLILSVNPELTAEEVKDILKISAQQIDPAGGNYDANGHSRLYGFGRANARAALQEALDRKSPAPSVKLVQFEREPNLDIPDNNPIGITDSINVTRGATVVSVQVEVTISHTYRGDLKLLLIAPDGTSVILYGRTSPVFDRSDNLIATFSLNNVPQLSNFFGKSAQGQWSLQVIDLAAADFGELEAWSLTLGLSTLQNEWSVSPGLHLPDNNAAGVISEIEVDSAGILRQIEVNVDITHTYRGDLKVNLEAPSGFSVVLHSVNNRDSEDDLRVIYSAIDTSGLQALVDQNININGTWRLTVSDNLSQDVGKLNSWGLRLIT